MSDEVLGDRRRALEDSFFAKQNAKLIEDLRKTHDGELQVRGLSAASGITDSTVLHSLVDHGITAETLAALALIPLVAVAWADGTVEDRERKAVMEGARASGINEGGISHALLEHWLGERPGPDLLETWKGYTRALVATLSWDLRESLKDDLLGRARDVARAAGGFLGLGPKISPEESEVLAELEQAFE